MAEFLSVLIAAISLSLMLFLEWPRIKERFANAFVKPPKNQPISLGGRVKRFFAKLRKKDDPPPPPPTLKIWAVAFFKTSLALLVAQLYWAIFTIIFLPLQDSVIIRFSIIALWISSLFWAFKYIRHQPLMMILKLLGLGIVVFIFLSFALGSLNYPSEPMG